MAGRLVKHCFVCGAKLEDAGDDWLQCESESCGEMFLQRTKSNGDKIVVLVKTPLTPEEE